MNRVSLSSKGSSVPCLLTQGQPQTKESVVLGQAALDTYHCRKKCLRTISIDGTTGLRPATTPALPFCSKSHPLLAFRALTHLVLMHTVPGQGEWLSCLKALPVLTP